MRSMRCGHISRRLLWQYRLGNERLLDYHLPRALLMEVWRLVSWIALAWLIGMACLMMERFWTYLPSLRRIILMFCCWLRRACVLTRTCLMGCRRRLISPVALTSLPGVGVGAIFAPALKNSWCVTHFKSNSCNFRAWLLSVAGSLLLLGAVYAPHSGHSTKDRLAFFALVWEEWKTLQSRHQDALHLLLGDMNLPMLLRSGFANPGCRTNSVEELFVSTFLANMTLLNNFLALPRSTQVKGNVLDLALINRVDALVGFEVLSVRVAASDHFSHLCPHQVCPCSSST